MRQVIKDMHHFGKFDRRSQQHAHHCNKKINFGYNTNVNKVVRKMTEKPKKQLQTNRTQGGPETGPPLRESNLTLFLVSGILVYDLTKIIL